MMLNLLFAYGADIWIGGTGLKCLSELGFSVYIKNHVLHMSLNV